MKLREGIWYEAIFSTFVESTPYFTPLGFQLIGKTVKSKIYQTTRISLFLNLLEKAVLNVVDDPHLYYWATFKEETGGIPANEIDTVEGLPVLKKAYGYVLVRKERVLKNGNLYIVTFNVEKIIENPTTFEVYEPYSRCRAFLIEMIIYASKIKDVPADVDNDLLGSFKKSFDYSYEIVEKTCLNGKDLNLASELKEMVSRWLKRY